ncbi:MAG: Co2+/Mg2+ efflux protein ApaG [Brevundimonas sp.]
MKRKGSYEAETRGIRVQVTPIYLDAESAPEEGRWVWAYHIEIENRSELEVQLMARRWVITDARGHVEEVGGPGVVGEQPVLGPGESYTYASGCPLTTSSGAMQGDYRMVDEAGVSFDVTIPPFSLDVPDARRVLN